MRLIIFQVRVAAVAIGVGLGIIILLALTFASTAADGPFFNQVFLPAVSNGPTITPTPTVTATPTLTPNPTSTPGSVLVTGYVKDAATGKGLQNANVILVGSRSLLQYSATTNGSGAYLLTVPADFYDLWLPDYPTSPPYSYTEEHVPGVDARFAPGPFDAPDILMDANGATVTGVVTNATTGQLLTNGAATVEVDLGMGASGFIQYGGNESKTDGSGHYTTSVAPSNNLVAEAFADGNACYSIPYSTPIPVAKGQTVTINFSLSPC